MQAGQRLEIGLCLVISLLRQIQIASGLIVIVVMTNKMFIDQ